MSEPYAVASGESLRETFKSAGIEIRIEGKHELPTVPKWALSLWHLLRSAIGYWDVRDKDPDLARRAYIDRAMRNRQAIIVDALRRANDDPEFRGALGTLTALGESPAASMNAVAEFVVATYTSRSTRATCRLRQSR